MKSGRFADLHARSPRFFAGRLRGPRSWVGGLLDGAHARALHSTRTPSQRGPGWCSRLTASTFVAANQWLTKHLNRCTQIGEEPDFLGRRRLQWGRVVAPGLVRDSGPPWVRPCITIRDEGRSVGRAAWRGARARCRPQRPHRLRAQQLTQVSEGREG